MPQTLTAWWGAVFMARTMVETPKFVKPIAASRVAMRFTGLAAARGEILSGRMTLQEQKQHRLGLILVACAALSWTGGGPLEGRFPPLCASWRRFDPVG